MAGPWEKYQQKPSAPAQAPVAAPVQNNGQPWGNYEQKPSPTVFEGSVLPLSKDAEGNVHFDSNAGLVGTVKRAFMAPGDAMNGNLQVLDAKGDVTPEAIARGYDFASTFSPMNPGVRSGDMAVPGVKGAFKTPDVEAPTAEALKAAAKQGYEELRGLGVDYKTSAVNDLSGQIGTLLTQDGITPSLAPKTYSVLAGLSEAPEGSVASLDGLTAARRAFGHAAADFSNPTEQLAAKRAMEQLDQFISRSDPASVVRGPAEQVGPILSDARGNYAAAKRSETLTDLTDAAQLRANAANSGANAGNTTRQRVASLLLNDKQSAGFSPEEMTALRGVNEGGPAANATRTVGNLLAGGRGVGASLLGLGGAVAGASTGHPELAAAGASLPLAGVVSRELSNVLTERALSQVEKGVRKRSPLYEAMVKASPSEPKLPTKSAALVRAMLMANGNRSGGGGW